jgi:plasmid stability protein
MMIAEVRTSSSVRCVRPWEIEMVDILVRNVEKDVARRLKEKAAAKATSLNEVARAALRKDVRPSREELIEQARRIRAMGAYSDLDSTALIREDRDNDEPYR